MHVIHADMITARKRHDCFGCSGHIEPGEEYERAFCRDGSDVFTTKLCQDCIAFLLACDWYNGDSFCEGELANMKRDWEWKPGEGMCVSPWVSGGGR